MKNNTDSIKTKRAFITGVTGQDGAYLARLLLAKGYHVTGGYHEASKNRTRRLKKLAIEKNIDLVKVDLLDIDGLKKLISNIQPTELYNLAAQSFVHQSFADPAHTGNITGLGVHNVLESMRLVNPEIRYYQASSSEIFGDAHESPQNELTSFQPRSPYGIAKLYGHWATVNYRESYNLFAVSGILFNHESPLRSKEFVTRKISTAVSKIKAGQQDHFEIGALDVKRDWGYAPEYVEGMWKMLQTNQPKDYVLSTGENHSVREWIEACFAYVDIHIEWDGEQENERGRDSRSGNVLVKVSPAYYRPSEITALVGDSSLARKDINWSPSIKFENLIKIMMQADLERNYNKSYVQ